MLCKKCGNNVKSDFKYCPYCGERIVSDFHDHYEELTPPFLGPGTGRAGRCGGLVRRSAGGSGRPTSPSRPRPRRGSLPSRPGPFRRRTWRTTSRRPISGFPCRRSRPPAGTAAPLRRGRPPGKREVRRAPRASSRWTTRPAVGGALFRLPSGAGRADPRNRPRRETPSAPPAREIPRRGADKPKAGPGIVVKLLIIVGVLIAAGAVSWFGYRLLGGGPAPFRNTDFSAMFARVYGL